MHHRNHQFSHRRNKIFSHLTNYKSLIFTNDTDQTTIQSTLHNKKFHIFHTNLQFSDSPNNHTISFFLKNDQDVTTIRSQKGVGTHTLLRLEQLDKLRRAGTQANWTGTQAYRWKWDDLWLSIWGNRDLAFDFDVE